MLSLFPQSPSGVIHAYSIRSGGVSDPPFDSLNLGDHVGDDPERVRINREALSRAAGVPADRWVTAEQVHGSAVAVVTESDAGTKIPGVDALVTDAIGLPLALFFADCASILLVDPIRRAVGIAHAGWKGTANRIARKTVEAMAEAFGSRPEELRIAVGPHIRSCCYEVGENVEAALGEWEGAIRFREGRRFADLGAANRAQLIDAGAREERIAVSGLCSSCDPERFFSYRRDGRTGRMAAILMLSERR